VKLATPRADQGQIVEVSYGWHDGSYFRKTYDRSDRTITWDVADEDSSDRLAMTGYDAGGADYAPTIDGWTPCEEPKE